LRTDREKNSRIRDAVQGVGPIVKKIAGSEILVRDWNGYKGWEKYLGGYL
jgi:hypothetical protein